MSKRSSGPRIAPPKGPRLGTPQPATPPTMVQLGADRLFGGAREVAFGQITPDPDQPRKYMHPDRLAELSDSIVQHGLLQPIVVRQAGLDRGGDMRYIVVAGGRRYAAIKLALDTIANDEIRARLARIPVIINDSAEAERRVLQLIENLQREDLNGVEEARALKEIARIEGLTTVGLAGRVHRSQGYVDERLRLLRHEDVEDAVATGLLTKSAGAAIASIPAADARQEWLARARSGETIRPREVYATKPKRRRAAPKPAPGGEPDPDLLGTVARRAMALRDGDPDLTREESFHLAAVEARDAGTLDADTAGRLFGTAARLYRPGAVGGEQAAVGGEEATDTAPDDTPPPHGDADAPFAVPGNAVATRYPDLPPADAWDDEDDEPIVPDTPAAVALPGFLGAYIKPTTPAIPLTAEQMDRLLRAVRAVRERLAARPGTVPPRRAELATELRALLALLGDD